MHKNKLTEGDTNRAQQHFRPNAKETLGKRTNVQGNKLTEGDTQSGSWLSSAPTAASLACTRFTNRRTARGGAPAGTSSQKE